MNEEIGSQSLGIHQCMVYLREMGLATVYPSVILQMQKEKIHLSV